MENSSANLSVSSLQNPGIQVVLPLVHIQHHEVVLHLFFSYSEGDFAFPAPLRDFGGVSFMDLRDGISLAVSEE